MMSALRLFPLLALTAALLLALSGCKPSDPPPPDYGEHEGYGVIHAKFSGTFTDEDERRPEDNSPVHYHDIALTKGQHVNVRMVATTDLNTFMMIGTPDRTGGYRNGSCFPGKVTESCIRFVAEQDGEYRIFANTATEEDRGSYELFVYLETPEEAQQREAQLALDREEAKRKAQEQYVEELLGRIAPEERERIRARMQSIAEQRAAKAAAEAAGDAAPNNDAAPADEAPADDAAPAPDEAPEAP